ncbi:MAG: diadenylate cyclase CdaA [Oscillospiraceae bacterium]|nr:diadenylate cyclase CdaA [Oscillospiraceae bacterium]
MESIMDLLGTTASYVKTIGLADIVDILIVAYLIYKAIFFIRKTNSYNIARSILLLAVAYVLSYAFGLTMIRYLLRAATEIGVISLVILFQPELRRLLDHVGSSFSTNRQVSTPALETAIAQVVQACSDMSASRTGALLVFERSTDLSAVMTTGTDINADISAELLKNLFYNKAPLHDGAVMIRDAKIASAGCVLPLSKSLSLTKDLGMRHRAGIGMSEESDAVVVIVSEETGAISMALDGMLKRHLNAAALTQLLHSELIVDQEEPSLKERILNLFRSLKKAIKRPKDGKE